MSRRLGSAIHRHRTDIGLFAMDFARALDVSESTLSRWEGGSEPSLEQIARVRYSSRRGTSTRPTRAAARPRPETTRSGSPKSPKTSSTQPWSPEHSPPRAQAPLLNAPSNSRAPAPHRSTRSWPTRETRLPACKPHATTRPSRGDTSGRCFRPDQPFSEGSTSPRMRPRSGRRACAAIRSSSGDKTKPVIG